MRRPLLIIRGLAIVKQVCDIMPVESRVREKSPGSNLFKRLQ